MKSSKKLQARMVALVLAASTVISILFCLYAFEKHAENQKLKQELEVCREH